MTIRVSIRIYSFVFAMLLPIAPALAGDSSQAVDHSAHASGHAASAAIHGAASTGKVLSGAVAVPLGASAVAGASAGAAGDSAAQIASAPAGTPLPISDETVTAGPPPDEALKTENKQADHTKETR